MKHIDHYPISSNNSQGRWFLFSHQRGVIMRAKAIIIRGRRLFQIFQIFLTGGREKVEYMKKWNTWIEKTVKKTGAFVTIQLWTIKWKLVCCPRCQFLTWEGGNKRKRKWRGGGGRLFEGGDYFKYFGQRGRLLEGSRRLIEGRLLFEEIRYLIFNIVQERRDTNPDMSLIPQNKALSQIYWPGF